MKTFTAATLFSLLIFFSLTSNAKTQEYDLEIKQETVNFTGNPVDFALTVNGGIPGPTLRFVEGDIAVIRVKNSTNEDTSVHWHGLLVPWNMDGVPGLNTPSIKPGTTFTYSFPLRHSGTYWYHSHTNLQEQRGVFGSIVIEPKQKALKVDHDVVLVLSDWIDEHPKQVMANLKKDGDYYAWKKNTVPNYLDAMKEGSLKAYLINQWNRMDGMDFGDIGYDTFLINGKNKSSILPNLKKGDKVRLRIINAGASSYFHVNLAKRHFMTISADGMDVQPVMTKELLMGMAETYDILFTVPEDNVAYEFRATPQDVTGFASVVLGKGHHTEMAPMKMKPSIYKMGMSHGGDDMDDGDDHDGGHGEHSIGDMDMPTKPLKYSQLKAKHKTSFPSDKPVMEFEIDLSGDMERYVWTLNGNLLSEDTYIKIEEGSVIRFKLNNKTMMHHPMHLHGHFFRVLSGQGDFAPLKHTVDVPPCMPGMPMSCKPIIMEFLANEPGEWFFHCHNLYHMKAGMARVVQYTNFKRPTDIVETAQTPIKDFKKMDSKLYPSAEVGAYTNGATWQIKYNGGRYEVAIEGEITDYDREKIENEIYVRHYFNRYFNAFGGLEYQDEKFSPIAGISWVIPLNFELISFANGDGDLVFKVEKTIQITKRIYIEAEAKHRFMGKRGEDDETEFGLGLNYQLNKRVSIGARYVDRDDIDDYYGVGIRVRF